MPTIDDILLTGRQENAVLHRFLCTGPLRSARRGAGPEPSASPRPIRPGVAHAVPNGGVRLDGQGEPPGARASVSSLALAAEPDGTRLTTAFQNTRRTS